MAATSCLACAFGGSFVTRGDVFSGIVAIAGGLALSVVALMLASVSGPDPALWGQPSHAGPPPARHPNS
jgi:hypothetical protein